MNRQQIENGRNEIAELKLNLSEYRGKWKSADGLTKVCSWADEIIPNTLQTSACLMMQANGLYHRNIVRMVGRIYIMPITMRLWATDDEIQKAREMEEQEWWVNKSQSCKVN